MFGGRVATRLSRRAKPVLRNATAYTDEARGDARDRTDDFLNEVLLERFLFVGIHCWLRGDIYR